MKESEVPKRNGLSEGIPDVVFHHIALCSILQLLPTLVPASNLKGATSDLKIKMGEDVTGRNGFSHAKKKVSRTLPTSGGVAPSV